VWSSLVSTALRSLGNPLVLLHNDLDTIDILPSAFPVFLSTALCAGLRDSLHFKPHNSIAMYLIHYPGINFTHYRFQHPLRDHSISRIISTMSASNAENSVHFPEIVLRQVASDDSMTTPHGEPTPAPTFRFTDLPIELRLLIERMSIAMGNLAIADTSQAIRREAAPLVDHEAIYRIRIYTPN
jgi:hypothetical protein